MAKATAGNHRHERPAGTNNRAQHQAYLVTDAAGRMLVHHRSIKAKRLPVQNRTAIAHVARKGRALVHGHAIKEHSHGKGGNLPFADAVICDALDEKGDLSVCQNFAFAFTANDFLGQHVLSPAHVSLIQIRRFEVTRLQEALEKYCSNILIRLAEPAFDISNVCSWLSGVALMPAARLVMFETAATLNPRRRARIFSGTVDMPTASAPRTLSARISAGVSKLGPVHQQ